MNPQYLPENPNYCHACERALQGARNQIRAFSAQFEAQWAAGADAFEMAAALGDHLKEYFDLPGSKIGEDA